MPIEIANGKWREETPHGRICQIRSEGIHVQRITDLPDQIIAHDEKVVSFESVCDLADGQKTLI